MQRQLISRVHHQGPFNCCEMSLPLPIFQPVAFGVEIEPAGVDTVQPMGDLPATWVGTCRGAIDFDRTRGARAEISTGDACRGWALGIYVAGHTISASIFLPSPSPCRNNSTHPPGLVPACPFRASPPGCLNCVWHHPFEGPIAGCRTHVRRFFCASHTGTP